jgi:16S rRNA (guanine966-N2)-methyltransferase
MRLRIIAGDLKGRFIQAPRSEHTRPTTDRVRESVFNYLSNIIAFDDINVLDLYAGSGALGFEALSRGAGRVTFIERNFQPYKNLQNNINLLGVESQCVIKRTTAEIFSSTAKERFELILADPPFFAYDIYQVVKSIVENSIIAKNGLMIIERSIQTLEKDIAGIGSEPYRRIGDTCLYEIRSARAE